MKKIVFLFGAILLALTSCTHESNTDDIDTVSDAQLLVKKMINDDHEPYVIFYEGSKIIKAETSKFSSVYTYEGDFITKEESTDVDYLINTEYTYENGKLKSSLRKENNGNGTPLIDRVKEEYTYNTDGTIAVKTIGYSDGIVTTVFTFKNGNIVKEVEYNESGESVSTTVYEYDTKHNPLKNILGFDKLMEAQQSSKNNILKTTQTYGSGEYTSTTVVTNVYIYNVQGYPLSVNTTEVNSYGGGNETTDTYKTKYEY